ncbi:MAG TPA: tetratricopeptide repeat protein [Chthoniobacterales bacterium]|nr:tetratricopeptide repeat protein [Chthoniobacterales bacterium]
MRQRLIICATLVVLVFIAHAPALWATFVWDDTALVLRDPLIRSWRLIPEGFQHFLFVDATPSNFYRPLQRLSYVLEYWRFAFRPGPYHFTNILLHSAAAIAFFVFAQTLLRFYGTTERRSAIIAAVASLAWALHPVHSGVVDYVAGRADSLAALFGFVGLYCLVRALNFQRGVPWKFCALSGVALLASALSKETGLVFAGLAIILILLTKKWRALPAFGIALIFVLAIYAALRNQVPPVEVPQLSPPAPALVRPIIALRSLAEYADVVVAPMNLHMERDVENHPWGYEPASLTAGAWRELQTVAGIIVLGVLLWWTWRSWKRSPAIFALLILAGVSYLPVCGFFSLNANIAEHWIYVPSAFLLLAVTLQVTPLIERNRAAFSWAIAIAALWIVFLGVRTFIRAQDWRDPRTFFTRTISAGGDSARMLINLGGLELSEGHLEKAETLFQRALAKSPEQPFALLNLAAVALKRNDLKTARGFLGRAQKNSVSLAQAEEMLAMVEQREKGQIDLVRLRMAARTDPPSWPIMRRYLAGLAVSGQLPKAVAELQVLLQTEWYRAESWQLLGEYLTRLGQTDESAKKLAKAHAFDVHLNDH